MKFHRSVPSFVREHAEFLLANFTFPSPRKERLLALVGADSADERLDDFYRRLADSNPEQVKRFIFLFVSLDPDLAFRQVDEEIEARKELIPSIRKAACEFIAVSSQYLEFFPFSINQGFTKENIILDDSLQAYFEEMEAFTKAVSAANECLTYLEAPSAYVDHKQSYALSSRKKTLRARRMRQLVQLFYEEKIELVTSSLPAVLGFANYRR
ncbi:hypothetical protein [Candidatus Contendibacter odensensis]|uniref:Uncharacterized protein n=1 Tax=Candidatus Contendobacter odensis Run_B_J11 TaxID=1400861 RepID=A0A7U7GBZ8_9GAMM|nr:hypothetical protein [Candidatus Contendobacter odensis]CDH45371.1 hypothetical protein BN874_230018 [Candidatus Contendobacter odensis Run_B_J11]